MLIAGVDTNSSIGCGSLGGDDVSSERAGAVAPSGMPHIHASDTRHVIFQQLASLAWHALAMAALVES